LIVALQKGRALAVHLHCKLFVVLNETRKHGRTTIFGNSYEDRFTKIEFKILFSTLTISIKVSLFVCFVETAFQRVRPWKKSFLLILPFLIFLFRIPIS